MPAKNLRDVYPDHTCQNVAPPTEVADALRAELKQLAGRVAAAGKGAATWTGDSAKEIRDDQNRIQANSVGLLTIPVRDLSLDSEILTPRQNRAARPDLLQR